MESPAVGWECQRSLRDTDSSGLAIQAGFGLVRNSDGTARARQVSVRDGDFRPEWAQALHGAISNPLQTSARVPPGPDAKSKLRSQLIMLQSLLGSKGSGW